MPGRNGKGPTGQGPMTGRGMGWCGGANATADVPPRGPGFGMGWGGGRGGGWRHRNWFQATGLTGWQRAWMGLDFGAAYEPDFSREQKLAELKQQASALEQALSEMKARIQELVKSTPDAKKTESR